MNNPTTAIDNQNLFVRNRIPNGGFESGLTGNFVASDGTLTVLNSGSAEGNRHLRWVVGGAGTLDLYGWTTPSNTTAMLFAKFAYWTAENVFSVKIYNYSDSQDIGLSTSLPISLNWNRADGQCSGMFNQTTPKQVIVRITASGAGELHLDDAFLDYQQFPNVAINYATDWQAYTPTFTGFGTVSNINFKWRQDGPDLLIEGKFTSTSPTNTEARVTLPTGLLSANDIPTLIAAGEWYRDQTVTAHGGAVLIEPSVSYITFGHPATYGNSSISAVTKDVGSSVLNTGTGMVLKARVRIQGWTSGNKTIGDIAVNIPAAMSGSKSGTQAVTAGSTDITFTSTYDVLSGWNGSQYTVKQPGDYVLTSSASETGAVGFRLVAYVNGITTNKTSTFVVGQPTNLAAVLTNLKIGDTISVRSAKNVTIATNAEISLAKISNGDVLRTFNRSTTKYLASHVTSNTADVASLKGALVVGRKYSVYVNLNINSTTSIDTRLSNNSVVVGRSRNGSLNGNTSYQSIPFVATHTDLIFSTSNMSGATLFGNGAVEQTFIVITELNDTIEGNF